LVAIDVSGQDLVHQLVGELAPNGAELHRIDWGTGWFGSSFVVISNLPRSAIPFVAFGRRGSRSDLVGFWIRRVDHLDLLLRGWHRPGVNRTDLLFVS